MSVLQDMLMRNPNVAGRFMTGMPATFWVKNGEKKAVGVFQDAAKNVRAYREFLEGHGVDPSRIRTLEDFRTVPHTSKATYFAGRKLEELVAGDLTEAHLFYMSGGTTGDKSMLAVAGRDSVRAYPPSLAAVMHLQWGICDPKNKVLVVNALSMGAWMGSTFVSRIFGEVSDRYPNISYTGPGADVERTIDIIEAVGGLYDMVLLWSYPTLLKEILHAGTVRGIDWHALNVKVSLSGEPLDAALRSELVRAISAKGDRNVIMDTYGGTEIGNPGTETALTHTLSRLIEEDPSIAAELFGGAHPYAIQQHNPMGTYVEIEDSELIVTYGAMMPAVRYESRDTGVLVSYDSVMSALRERGIDVIASVREDGWEKPLFKWPFLGLLGRADYAVSIYGAKIAPLAVQPIFAHDSRVRRFSLRRDTQGEYTTLWVEVELQRGVVVDDLDRARMVDHYSVAILDRLLAENLDYRDAYSIHAEAMLPRVVVHTYDEGYFSEPRGDFKPKTVHQG